MSFPFTRLRARAYTSFPCHTAPADNASNGPSPQHAADVFRRLPDQNTLRVFNRTSCFGAFRFAVLPKEQKTRQQKLLSGTKSWTLRCHPALTRHRCRTHSSTANTVRLLTRALRPRLLVAFRLGPPGPILSGSVPAGITPPPTLSESVTRFLPVNGLLNCLNTITAFFCCQRIFCSSATFFIIEPFPALSAFFSSQSCPPFPFRAFSIREFSFRSRHICQFCHMRTHPLCSSALFRLPPHLNVIPFPLICRRVARARAHSARIGRA